jgi:pimeloyl-ACP methyl ester carboxylesterase
MVLPATAYTRGVVKALDAAGVPRGAPALLVGHSQGGIVAMDLAGDPAFNGERVRVTHVVAAGSPISSKQVVPGSATRVVSVENVNDVVTHLDAVDAAPETPQRLTYQFAADGHDVVRTHDAGGYARRIEGLDDSPNPLWRAFADGVTPYLRGATSTIVFNLADAPPN